MRSPERRKQAGWGYWAVTGEGVRWMGMRELVEQRDEGKIWSVRLSTGLLGRVDCESGNRGPKNSHEVMVVDGATGVRQAVEWGFIPCPTCRPEKDERIQAVLWEVANSVYGAELEQLVDKRVVGFDPSRIAWEMLVPVLQGVPGRIYLSSHWGEHSEKKIRAFRKRFEALGYGVPSMGWYDRGVAGRFREYEE